MACFLIKNSYISPGWVSQLVRVLFHMPKCCGFDSWLGCIQESTDWCFSLTSLFLSLHFSLPLSLKSINISLGEDWKRRILPSLWFYICKELYFSKCFPTCHHPSLQQPRSAIIFIFFCIRKVKRLAQGHPMLSASKSPVPVLSSDQISLGTIFLPVSSST